MSIGYLAPLRRGWTRTRRLLFSPFDLGRWIVLGFAAFLASVTDLWESFGSGLDFNLDDTDGETVRRIVEEGATYVFDKVHLLIAGAGLYLAASIAVGLLLIYLVLLWVGSRGKFILLDDLAHRRARITEPWKGFRAAGNSLFRFRLVFDVLNNLLILGFVLTALIVFVPSIVEERLLPVSVGSLAVALWVGLVLLVIGAYIKVFLENFVIPIMYRDRVGVLEAWRRFGGLFREYTMEFLLFGVFVLVFWLAVGTAVLLFGFATCCVGYIILAIPYLESVLLLPVTLTYRGLGPEFLAQFGPGHRVFPEEAPPPPPAGTLD